MAIRKSILVLLAIAFASSFGLNAWASEKNLQLMPLKGSPNATGTIQLGENRLKIDVAGLKANSVYTVWFVNKKPKMQKAGAGEPPYMFKTDSAGKGSYNSPLAKSPFGRWGLIMVVLHPTGDPKDMKNMVGAFAAKIPRSAK